MKLLPRAITECPRCRVGSRRADDADLIRFAHCHTHKTVWCLNHGDDPTACPFGSGHCITARGYVPEWDRG